MGKPAKRSTQLPPTSSHETVKIQKGLKMATDSASAKQRRLGYEILYYMQKKEKKVPGFESSECPCGRGPQTAKFLRSTHSTSVAYAQQKGTRRGRKREEALLSKETQLEKRFDPTTAHLKGDQIHSLRIYRAIQVLINASLTPIHF